MLASYFADQPCSVCMVLNGGALPVQEKVLVEGKFATWTNLSVFRLVEVAERVDGGDSSNEMKVKHKKNRTRVQKRLRR